MPVTLPRLSRSDLRGFAVLIIVGIMIGATVFAFVLYETTLNGIPSLPTGPFRFLIAGDLGGLYTFDGSNLESVGVPTSSDLNQVAWRHDRAYALIAGDGGTLLKYHEGSVEIIATSIPSSTNLYTVSWKQDDSEALIAGSGGTVLRFDGNAIEKVASGISATVFSARWKPDGTIALLAGAKGLVAKYDGANFTKVYSPITVDLYDVEWDPSGSYALIGGLSATLKI